MAALLGLLPSPGVAAAPAAPPEAASLLLVTLDTTRADVLGSYGGRAETPHLDRLAARGVRFRRALTVSPLTLPAHATLLTGREPPEHGVRVNGATALGSELPTLAAVLADAGWDTAAVVASRVLDRRFGLARGFAHYDDRMAAELTGEYGYAERDAAAVTDAALTWWSSRPAAGPRRFLWVHYYDPHAPYDAPAAAPDSRDGDAASRYRAEVAWVDLQLGRLLAALPPTTLVAVVGDHGEALGEHGERTHGLFLYDEVLRVPLLLAGPGVAAGVEVQATVGTARLAATLLDLLGLPPRLPGPPLPGVLAAEVGRAEHGSEQETGNRAEGEDPEGAPGVRSEALQGAAVYGWSPVVAWSHGDAKLVVAPRPELYDLGSDPAEADNRIDTDRRRARRLADELRRHEAGMVLAEAPPVATDAALAADLASLGYLGAGGSPAAGRLDPKDGLPLLARFDEAKAALAAGHTGEALAELESLVAASPANVPFLAHLAEARVERALESAAGDSRRAAEAAALEAYDRALELAPRHLFVRLGRAGALRRIGRPAEAEAELRRVLDLDPRAAPAWLQRAEMAHDRGASMEERRLLTAALEAGVVSAAVAARLGQLELERGEAGTERAAELLGQAAELAPGWPLVWLLRGRVELARGEPMLARRYLRRAEDLAPASPEGREARRLLVEQAEGGH